MSLGRLGLALIGIDLLRKQHPGPVAPAPPARLGGPRAQTAYVRTMEDRRRLIHAAMKRGAEDPDVIALTRRVLSRPCGDGLCLRQKDWKGYITALYDWFCANMLYVPDPVIGWKDGGPLGIDMYADPGRTLFDTHAGDCDCLVAAFGAMCMSVGFPMATSILHTYATDEYPQGLDHILPLVGLPPDAPEYWLPCDVTESKWPGWFPAQGLIETREDRIVE
jgi:hypothetical protein